MNFSQAFPFGMTASQIQHGIQAGLFTEPVVSGAATHRPFAKKLAKLLNTQEKSCATSRETQKVSPSTVYYWNSRRESKLHAEALGLHGGRGAGRKPRRSKQNRETIRGAFLH
jgi:hypothetical protein